MYTLKFKTDLFPCPHPKLKVLINVFPKTSGFFVMHVYLRLFVSGSLAKSDFFLV